MNTKNAGSMVVVAVYGALGIEAAIRGYCEQRNLPYDLNAVLRLLVVEQIVGSGSVEEAWQRRKRYFFGCDFTEDDLQSALGELPLCRQCVRGAVERALEGTDMAGSCGVARKRKSDGAQTLVDDIALTITRLLRRATGVREAVIRKELSLMICSALDDGWWLSAHRSDASDLLVDAVGLPELKYKYLRTADMRSILEKAEKSGLPQTRQV